MRLVVLASLSLSGCNWLFGLTPGELIDGATGAPSGDGGMNAPPIVPPDGTTECGASPSFESWTYAPRTLPFQRPIYTFGLHARDGITRLMVSDGTGIWDVDPGSGATQIPDLAPPPGKSISSLAVTPDGAALWFKIEDATYVALRSRDYAREVTELGVPAAYEILPGAAAYYAGTVRMVVRLRDAISSETTYVELSSPDGVTWTRGQTLQFGGAGYWAAALAPDGCAVFFSRMEGGSSYVLYYAERLMTGAFSDPIRLTAATNAGGGFPINPALAPDRRGLWFSANQTLIEGHP